MKDHDELEGFCRREHAGLVRSLTLYTGDPLVAEECAQEALLVACRRWPEVAVMASPAGWLHRVAFNHAHAHFRRRRAEWRALQRRNAGTEEAYELPDTAGAIALRTAVGHLPHQQRAALVLRYLTGFDVAETAAVLGISPEAVRSLTHRAIVALRSRGHDFTADEVGEVADAS